MSKEINQIRVLARCPDCDQTQIATVDDGEPEHPLFYFYCNIQHKGCGKTWRGPYVVVGESAPSLDPVCFTIPEGDNQVGLKYDAGKTRLDLLDTYAVEQLAQVLAFGAKKYAAHNWRKGIEKSRLIAAALRHLFSYLKGEDTDPETGLSHAAHAMCCCMFLLGLEHRTDLDDRFPLSTSTPKQPTHQKEIDR